MHEVVSRIDTVKCAIQRIRIQGIGCGELNPFPAAIFEDGDVARGCAYLPTLGLQVRDEMAPNVTTGAEYEVAGQR